LLVVGLVVVVVFGLPLELHLLRLERIVQVVGFLLDGGSLLLDAVSCGQEGHYRLELDQREGALLVVQALLQGKVLVRLERVLELLDGGRGLEKAELFLGNDCRMAGWKLLGCF